MAVGKQELVAVAAEGLGATKKATAEAFDAIVGAIKESLEAGQEVSIAGLVSFKQVETAAHTRTLNFGDQPQTVEVPAKSKVVAKASKTFVKEI